MRTFGVIRAAGWWRGVVRVTMHRRRQQSKHSVTDSGQQWVILPQISVIRELAWSRKGNKAMSLDPACRAGRDRWGGAPLARNAPIDMFTSHREVSCSHQDSFHSQKFQKMVGETGGAETPLNFSL